MTLRNINWTYTLFFILTPIVAILGTVYLALTGGIHKFTVIFALIMLLLTGISITAGYHRCFSHGAYEAHPVVRWLFVFFGSAAFEGAVLEWCTDHRMHHRYTDTEKDPYNVKQSFWHAHIGWIFTLDESKRDFSNVDDLMKDPLLRFQKDYYSWIATVLCFFMPMGVASLWGDPLGGLILAGALRVSLNHHFTFLINSACHYFGTQPYSDQGTARDNPLMALFTYGEGYHNFHHKFPLDFRNGIRFYDFDPSKWLIKSLSWVGLAKNLKKVDEHKILSYRIRMDEKQLLEQAKKHSSDFFHKISELLHPAKAAVMNSIKTIESMDKVEASKECLLRAKEDLKNSLIEWQNAISRVKMLSKAHAAA